jgi:uncharacterized BrkB/YihY/UPF0761 family membrane protein
VMSALVFFQVSSLIVILGAEINRGIMEVKRKLAVMEELESEMATGPAPPSRASFRLEI